MANSKGEGSKGGHVIGHTKSGKPIYEQGNGKATKFDRQDHIDASQAHREAAEHLRSKGVSSADQKIQQHVDLSSAHYRSAVGLTAKNRGDVDQHYAAAERLDKIDTIDASKKADWHRAEAHRLSGMYTAGQHGEPHAKSLLPGSDSDLIKKQRPNIHEKLKRAEKVGKKLKAKLEPGKRPHFGASNVAKKALDVDIDEGVYGVANDESGQVAMRVEPNDKCNGCAHYASNSVACLKGLIPELCGEGLHPEIGYEPTHTDQATGAAWRAAHADKVAQVAQATIENDVNNPVVINEIPYKIEVLGDSALTMGEALGLVKKAVSDPAAVVGHIWYHGLSAKKRKTIKGREGKKPQPGVTGGGKPPKEWWDKMIAEVSSKKAFEHDTICKAVADMTGVLMKAEGERGGKIIGHTKSGKPIYAPSKEFISKFKDANRAYKKARSATTRKAGYEARINAAKKENETMEVLNAADREHVASHPFDSEEHNDAYHAHYQVSRDAAAKNDSVGEDLHLRIATLHDEARQAMTKKSLAKADKHGEGSRGGHIIGHTRSGKPIYELTIVHHEDPHFSKQDHLDAAAAHRAQAKSHANSLAWDKKYGHNTAEYTDWETAKMHAHERKAGDHERLAAMGDAPLGHTRSGKPIYGPDKATLGAAKILAGSKTNDNKDALSEQANYHSHYRTQGFTRADHEDAADLHSAHGMTGQDPAARLAHYAISDEHMYASNTMENKSYEKSFVTERNHRMIKSIEFQDGASDQDLANAIATHGLLDANAIHQGGIIINRADPPISLPSPEPIQSTQCDPITNFVGGNLALADVMKSAKRGKGEGSKGGDIVGHTRSGKPIYGPAHKAHHGVHHYMDPENAAVVEGNHKDFSRQDHMDAGAAHRQAATKFSGNSHLGQMHEQIADAHFNLASRR